MNKLVSIVLPTYNGESFLKTSIQSCLDQDLLKDEQISE